MNIPDQSGQYKCLLKHFFGRFFDVEAIASPRIDSIEKNSLTFHILALLVLPGMLYSVFLFQKYGRYIYRPTIERDLATLTDKCFLLSLSMILIGFLTVFEWDMLFPDRKDYLILTHLPVRTRTIFYAKIAALALFLLAFSVAINFWPTFLFPGAVLTNNGFAHRWMGRTIPLSQGIRYVFSHATSMLLGNIFVFLSAISLQGFLLTFLPPQLAPVVSRIVRFLCLLLLFGALLTFPQILSVDQLIQQENPITIYYPPIWFIGMYEVLLGSRDPIIWGLAGKAFAALGMAGALSLLTYALCYLKFMKKSIESGGVVFHTAGRVRGAVNLALDRWFLREPEKRACYHFVGQTIFRSPRHILHIGTYLAVGLSLAGMGLAAMLLNEDPSVIRHLDRTIVSVPLILSFFLLVGMRVIFASPVDLESNWVFRLAPIQGIRSTYAGVRKFLIVAVVIPLYTFAGLFYGWFWAWSTALLHVCFGITMSLLLMEVLFHQFPKIPFTCSYLPGAARIVVRSPLYYVAFSGFGYAAANLEIWMGKAPHRFVYFYLAAAALFFILFRFKARAAGDKIRFEEESEEAPVYLDLRS
jgi:hypothetical protein